MKEIEYQQKYVRQLDKHRLCKSRLQRRENSGDWYLFHSIKGWGGLIHNKA